MSDKYGSSWVFLKNASVVSIDKNVINMKGSNDEDIRLSIMSNSLCRLLISPFGNIKDIKSKSWSVLDASEEDAPIQGRERFIDIAPKNVDNKSVTEDLKINYIKGDPILTVSTNEMKIDVRLSPTFSITMYSAINGSIIFQDHPTHAYSYKKGSQCIRHWQVYYEEDNIYGLGEVSGDLSHNNRRFRMAPRDAMGYSAENGGPLYKHIPYYILLNKSNQAAGVLYDNYSDCDLDMGAEIDNYYGRYRAYEAPHGSFFDCYYISGPQISQVVQRYVQLTGMPQLPPFWTLGYLGSSMAYTDAPDPVAALTGYVAKCDNLKVPATAFHLSSGYSMSEEGKRYVFQWNMKRVPSPSALCDTLHKGGMRIIANIKPALLTDHKDFEYHKEKKNFVLSKDNDDPYLSIYWGGEAAHLDFTKPSTRDWWKEQVKTKILGYGIDSTWNDNNEFDIRYPGGKCKEGVMGELRPVQTMLMMRSSRDAQLEFRPNVRPWCLSRSGGVGMQRYAQTWTGDNRTNWNTVAYNIPMGLNLALSGVPFNGHDVGGFAGPMPEPELLLRWIHNGIFHPRFCIHSWNSDGSGATEPWSWPLLTDKVVYAMSIRRMLIPFLYTLSQECASTGAPIHRPFIYHYQEDSKTRNISFDFLLGSSVLVPGVYECGITSVSLYLPGLLPWYDFLSGKLYQVGQRTISTPLDKPTFLVQSNSILPLANLTDASILDIHVFLPLDLNAEQIVSYSLYLDDGESLEYKNGNFSHLKLHVIFKKKENGDIFLLANSKINGKFDAHRLKKLKWVIRSENKEIEECKFSLTELIVDNFDI